MAQFVTTFFLLQTQLKKNFEMAVPSPDRYKINSWPLATAVYAVGQPLSMAISAKTVAVDDVFFLHNLPVYVPLPTRLVEGQLSPSQRISLTGCWKGRRLPSG